MEEYTIRLVEETKKQYLPLLLLADEQEDMVDRYLDRGAMYVLEAEGEVRGECVVTDEGGGVLEIKNIAVSPGGQRHGYGRALIEFVASTYRGAYRELQVGTGESPLTLPFYRACGFTPSHRVKNFFTDHYDHPIVEAGVQLVDMVYLRRPLDGPDATKMTFRWTDGRDPDFITLCHGLDQFLNELVGGEENRACYLPYNRLDDIHDALVAYGADGRPAGCASFKRYGADCAEVKRVFLRPEWRGQGLGRALMEHLEERARARGYRRLVLESGEPLAAAMGLYRRLGYRVIPNYGPYRDRPESICMKKQL